MIFSLDTYPSRPISVNGAELALSESPHEGKPILMIHGFSGAKEDLTPLFDEVGKVGYHGIAYDQRGHGLSQFTSSDAQCDIATLANDVLEVLDSLNIQKCVALGHSMGGMVLEEALISHPERFEAVIFMDTHYGALNIPIEVVSFIEKIILEGGIEALLKAAKATGMLAGSKPYENLIESNKDFETFTELKFKKTNPKIIPILAKEFSQRQSCLGGLSSLNTKALVISGSEDIGFIDACAEISKALKNSRFEIIENAGHLPQFENSLAFFETLNRFLLEI